VSHVHFAEEEVVDVAVGAAGAFAGFEVPQQTQVALSSSFCTRHVPHDH